MEWIKVNKRFNFLFKKKEEERELWLLQQLLREQFAMTKASVIANLFNVIVVAYVFWEAGNKSSILSGAALFGVLIAHRVSLSLRFQHVADDVTELKKLHQSVVLNALALGGWWGTTVFVLMLISNPVQALFVAILASGTAAAGAITYRTINPGAYFFVGTTALGCGAALVSHSSIPAYAAIFLLLSFVLVLFTSIGRTYQNIIARNRRERESKQSAETINMLLTDFTEQGSDWLLELDSDGRILNPGKRFAEAAQRPLETLEGMLFKDLFIDNDERQVLFDHIGNQRAFRNNAVAMNIGQEEILWSISARPVSSSSIAYRGVVSDITARREAENKITHMAHFDALTNLPNRFHFQNCLTDILHAKNGDLALMYLDLDEFKNINDTLGHGVGDLLLKSVAERLLECLEDNDLAARLGGDEFAIVLPACNAERLKAVVNDIVQSMALPFTLAGQDVMISTSIGVAFAPEHGRDASKLLSNADLALYEAKANGRNQYQIFAPGMDDALKTRRELEQDLKKALSQKELCLHYQPLVDIESGDAQGYEALIRWEHPTRGVVMPNDFIPIAEESGLIIPIGEWVIRQALDDLATWPEDRNISINLSPVQMRNPSLISTLIFALARTGVDPSRICLEITESVLMQDSDANIATLHKLHELGLQIALDDFGTGYSSLNYLRSFPFDKIKIDRCFISEMDSREDCQAIVRSVLDLANSLGMDTCAEGVEREDQVAMLRAEGCLEVQGFLYSKAVPQDQLTDMRRPTLSHSQKLAQLAKLRATKTRTKVDQKRKAG